MTGDIHILLVEDNPGDMRLLRELLDESSHRDGFQTDHREDLESCLQAIDQTDYSLVLLDLGLPDSQGMETFRSVFRQAQEIPIVILSGLSDEQTAIAAVQEGAEDFLPKGELTPSLLVRTLRHAVERHQLKQEARFLATHDQLTKVYNRHYFEQTLASEVARSTRYGHPIGFLMIDINRFKELNDRFGHESGDRALCQVADYLCSQLRSVDYVIRYGGDEFLAILPETNGGTDVLAQRIAATTLQVEVEGGCFPLTLSVGGSHWDPSQGVSIERALSEADENMYKAKACSRQVPFTELNKD